MKKIIELHICDACGYEITGETRYAASFGILNNWSDDAKFEEQHNKDLCCNCYKTMLQLIGEQPVHNEPTKTPDKRKNSRGNRYNYDKEELKKLWALGLSYKQIGEKLNVPRTVVRGIIQ